MGSPGFEPGSTAPKAASIAKLTHDPAVQRTRRPRENVSLHGPKGFTAARRIGDMVTTTEIALLLLVLALLFGAYRILKTVKPLVVNAIVGVIILFVANVVGFGVQITPIAVLVCAIGGVPGAVLVILLAYLDVAFAATLAPLAAGLVG